MAKTRIGKEIEGPNSERFRIERRLGNGSFGEVYKAVGNDSGMVVAVKMVPQAKLNDSSTLSFRTVLNEARIDLLKVSHPNVIRMLHVDTGSNPDIGPYLIMEYVDGGTLQQLLDSHRQRSEKLDLNEAVSLMREIALGVQAINEHLIHRDIKPDNILLDSQPNPPRPRIADFGISKIASASTRPETFKGIQMVWYMAPEVWRDETNTTKIDVYSTGLVFYEILSLSHPLLSSVSDPSDWIKWREVHLTTACPDVRSLRPDVPLSIAKLLLRMTDKSPGNRPYWDEILKSLSSEATPSVSPRAIDPQLIAAMKRQADVRFREEQSRSVAILQQQREAERNRMRSEEYIQSAKRLLTEFDEIIDALNQQETSYPITISGQDGLDRNYTLPNHRIIYCRIFSYHGQPLQPHQYALLGGGYVGISGGLSMNLILLGQLDDIASASWSAVEVNITAIWFGDKELQFMREAGLSNETMRFLLHEDVDQLWRRDCPTFFGFEREDLFYKHFESSRTAMGAYSLVLKQDVLTGFTELLKQGLLMSHNR